MQKLQLVKLQETTIRGVLSCKRDVSISNHLPTHSGTIRKDGSEIYEPGVGETEGKCLLDTTGMPHS